MTLLLRAETGSRAYGTNTPASDRDLVQVVVERPPFITGLSTFKTTQVGTSGQGNRSTSEDTDTVTYGLQKFADLAVSGNPSVLSLFFLSDFEYLSASGESLLDNSELFVSKNAGQKFLGYMISQRAAMTGTRNKRTNRPELVETYGFDTKFGMHMIRLGLMGRELMDTGTLQLPMRPDFVTLCMDIRAGKYTVLEVLEMSNELEASLNFAIDTADLPEFGDRDAVSDLIHEIYMHEWSRNVA